MQINNRTVVVSIIAIIALLWYVRKAKNDVSRYKNIIDTYMSESTSEKKSSMKKVRFNIPNEKKD